MARDERRPGFMVTPNVRLARELAVGGMGTIWLADHVALHTQVAVKFMDPELAKKHADLRARFAREAAVSARIRSVHAVQVFDHGIMADGAPYIVMELLEGRTLGDLLTERGALSLRETAHIVAQLARVLQRAHVLGIIHRDLKPENVFLLEGEYDLFVKLLDFGVAKQGPRPGKRKELTETGIAMGTLGYVSPEQVIDAKRADHRSDLWSLAAIAYEMLTLRIPFTHDEAQEGGSAWWMKLMRGELQRASEIDSALPPEIDEWFRRGLHAFPQERFQSAKEMAVALLEIAARERPSLSHSTAAMSAATGDDEPWATGEIPVLSKHDEEPISMRIRPYDASPPSSQARTEEGTTIMQLPEREAEEVTLVAATGRLQQPPVIPPVPRRTPASFPWAYLLLVIAIIATLGLLALRW